MFLYNVRYAQMCKERQLFSRYFFYLTGGFTCLTSGSAFYLSLLTLLYFWRCIDYLGAWGCSYGLEWLILANLQVVKTIEVFGLTATLGNTMYGTAFLATDLLNERYGKEDAKKAVWLGFFTLVMMTVIMQMVLLFEPSPSDMAQESLGQLFGLLPRIAAGSLAAYLVSQFADVYIFSYLKKNSRKTHNFGSATMEAR